MSNPWDEEFEDWWAKRGSLVRSGGGDYEKSFAYEAFRYLKGKSVRYVYHYSAGWFTDGKTHEVSGTFDVPEMLDDTGYQNVHAHIGEWYSIPKEVMPILIIRSLSFIGTKKA